MINIEEIIQELTEEEKNELLQELEDHRELKHKGARTSSISATQDMRLTTQRLAQEVYPHVFPSFRLTYKPRRSII
jgi:hypothetical protein